MGTSFRIVLHEPQIPQNTGAIARLCACTGASLHLIHPLGFDCSDRAVRRAGLDYWQHVKVVHHNGWAEFVRDESPAHLFFFTKFATKSYTEQEFPPDACLIFGNETTGLPEALHREFPDQRLRIPIRSDIVRSLNLAQAAAIGLYEAIRQNVKISG